MAFTFSMNRGTNFSNPAKSNDTWQSTKTFHASLSSGVTVNYPTCLITFLQHLSNIVVVCLFNPFLCCFTYDFLIDNDHRIVANRHPEIGPTDSDPQGNRLEIVSI